MKGCRLPMCPSSMYAPWGVNKFSQTKVVVNTTQNLASVRNTIESVGYGTVSVADTVAQIDSLFANFRLLLSVLGLVALSVAALGMFNTLTVSLLENQGRKWWKPLAWSLKRLNRSFNRINDYGSVWRHLGLFIGILLVRCSVSSCLPFPLSRA